MFAARRKLRVIGRTRILVLSINTKNILSQFGAPSGKRCATDCLGDFIILDIIILIHRGSLRVSVIIRCLETLKKYGISPIKLMTTISTNSGITIEDNPFKCVINVRNSCLCIKVINLYINIILYDGLVQKYSDVKLIRIIRLVLNIIVILGIKQDDENGSKDEKMSVIIKT